MYTLGNRFDKIPDGLDVCGRTADVQRTKNHPTPNVQNVHTSNAQRIYSVFISTLSYAQNFEHAQTMSETPAFLCVPQRTANVYNIRPTCHEQMTTYTNVHERAHKFPVRWTYVGSIRNSVTQASRLGHPVDNWANVCRTYWEILDFTPFQV